ncbi:flavin reductase [Marinobacter flavimaris]|uniref:Flavin reductase n=1 Tax=Marinobacter flavimaris TaxID=262076 RepID=A0A3D8GYK3_9GAMM|nr:MULTISPECIES: flavin reductase family protein [Marinobacter]MCK5866553.1 flavin reductase family protein [Marinobacter adhaerens]MBO6812082.1 flavin reductase family protein [Marinobacter sp.]MBO6873670.1 flavin reductase family protein [Marinobacter sp.]PPI78646.1 flavin reductase [Marinobacter flavimaris]RDU39269.1 flavin reductase [Marinobacter flavimaris]
MSALKCSAIEELDGQSFRQAVSLFATGIGVISSEDSHGDIHGATVNSFTSISLEPPTIMVSLKPGKMHGMLTERGSFGVSILGENHKDYSAYYSRRDLNGMPAPEFTKRQALKTLTDAIAWFECEVVKTVDVNDHTLFIARVTACGKSDTDSQAPLLFFASKYHHNPAPIA